MIPKKFCFNLTKKSLNFRVSQGNLDDGLASIYSSWSAIEGKRQDPSGARNSVIHSEDNDKTDQN